MKSFTVFTSFVKLKVHLEIFCQLFAVGLGSYRLSFIHLHYVYIHGNTHMIKYLMPLSKSDKFMTKKTRLNHHPGATPEKARRNWRH